MSREITPIELAERLERGDAVQVLDVRAPHRLASGVIEVRDPAVFTNLPNSKLFQLAAPSDGGLGELPVVAVCGHGNASKQTAAWLGERGVKAQSLAGGMAAWMQVVVPRTLAPPPGFSHFIQFDRLGKASLAYVLIADGEALIVDPPRDCTVLLQAIREAGARLIAAADTHVHADYLSGGRSLGVPYLLHPADAVYPYDGTPGRLQFTALADGNEIAIGNTSVRAMHTPGHTDGSVTLLANGAALTGDFLFVESIGRPDLAGKAEAWGRKLWASLQRARSEWAPDTLIYPAHYLLESERRPDRSVAIRFGDLPARNEVHRITNEDTFVAWILEHAKPAPEQYRQIKAVNVGLKDVTEEEAEILEAGKNECAVT